MSRYPINHNNAYFVGLKGICKIDLRPLLISADIIEDERYTQYSITDFNNMSVVRISQGIQQPNDVVVTAFGYNKFPVESNLSEMLRKYDISETTQDDQDLFQQFSYAHDALPYLLMAHFPQQIRLRHNVQGQ
tara:strand:+ start:4085 stop:4483 length:399 start_codon:yes stop_codon:yes gene_type:complete